VLATLWHLLAAMKLLTPSIALLLFSRWLVPAPAGQLFTSAEPIELTLEAPLKELFDKGIDDDKFSVRGALSYRDAATGSDVVVRDVDVSVRGHTSKRETECSFPKLKITFDKAGSRRQSIFAGLDGLRIGTHCGENPGEERTPKFGRLANEKSPLREALVYQLLAASGAATLQVRPARVTYVEKATQASPIVRNAMLLEDDDDLMKRLGATGEITMQQFSNARDRFAPLDTAVIAFAEAMIGNFDWCLRFHREDMYRCNARQPLWNVKAVRRADGHTVPVIADFDLAGMVVGKHNWFEKVYYAGFVESQSPVEIEVISQVQHTRSLFSRSELDATRRHFLDRRPALYDLLVKTRLDAHGRELAEQHLEAFFNAIATDAAFYRPVVVKPDTHLYADATKSREACAAGDTVLPGTPVNERRRDGTMAEVALLDARWHWAPPAECRAVKTGTVWIDADAISAEYPEK
jgi:hypothetical protein